MFLHRWLCVRFPSIPSCEILGHTLSPKCRQHAHETWMQLHHWISTNLSFFFFFVCVCGRYGTYVVVTSESSWEKKKLPLAVGIAICMSHANLQLTRHLYLCDYMLLCLLVWKDQLTWNLNKPHLKLCGYLKENCRESGSARPNKLFWTLYRLERYNILD